MASQVGKLRRWRTALFFGGVAITAILGVLSYGCYRQHRLAAEPAAALDEAFPPFAYDRDGNRVPGHAVDDGFVFYPAAGDAGSWGGIGSWVEYRNGERTELEDMPGVFFDLWLEQFPPEERERWRRMRNPGPAQPPDGPDAATPGEGDAGETE